jgi:hypothetical protein
MAKAKLRTGHRTCRAADPVSVKLDKSLLAYATAATAAGVGVLALVSPAEAKIVYTSANEQIGPNNTYPLDLNHDGIVDFTFVDSHFTSTFDGGAGVLTIFPQQSANEIWGNQSSAGFRRYASALAPGIEIGSKGKFQPGEMILAHSSSNEGKRHPNSISSYNCDGPWKHAGNRYLGLKFIINGEVHYGWARLSVGCKYLVVRAKLTGYAYETIPNKPIIAGQTKGADEDNADSEILHPSASQPATLGALALGSQGLSAWRRE